MLFMIERGMIWYKQYSNNYTHINTVRCLHHSSKKGGLGCSQQNEELLGTQAQLEKQACYMADKNNLSERNPPAKRPSM